MLVTRQINYLFLVATLTPLLSSASCWEVAGADKGFEPALLKALAWKESHGHPNAIGPVDPKTGHRALGLMQIYSVHLPRLALRGITREQLFDACTSEKVAAEVLGDCVHIFGNTWKAVGCYYTGPASNNVAAQLAYVTDVKAYYEGYKRQELRLAAQPYSVVFQGE